MKVKLVQDVHSLQFRIVRQYAMHCSGENVSAICRDKGIKVPCIDTLLYRRTHVRINSIETGVHARAIVNLSVDRGQKNSSTTDCSGMFRNIH